MSRGFLSLIQASSMFKNKWRGSEFQRSSTGNWDKTTTKQKSQECTRRHEQSVKMRGEGDVGSSNWEVRLEAGLQASSWWLESRWWPEASLEFQALLQREKTCWVCRGELNWLEVGQSGKPVTSYFTSLLSLCSWFSISTLLQLGQRFLF